MFFLSAGEGKIWKRRILRSVIDRYISRWNNSDDERTLAKYLGLNEEEEDVWIDESDEALREMLDRQKK